jgi:hypothetical protein
MYAPLAEIAGEEAVRETVTLTLIEGGAEATVAVEATAAVVATEVAVGTALVVGGIAVVAVVGIAALGYWLYSRSQPDVPAAPAPVTPCPVAGPQPVPVITQVQQPATLPTSTSASAAAGKQGNCGPDDCSKAEEAIRDLLKGGRTEKRSLKERLSDLRENKEGQPYDYPVDPVTGDRPPSEGATIRGHLDAIINQITRGKEAIQTYYRCGCSGLNPGEIRELGDLLLQDPLEGIEYKEPNYTTPAERIKWRGKSGKQP